jgi:hypothetical protein
MKNTLTNDDLIAAAIRRAVATHSASPPDYAKPKSVDDRFSDGDADDGWHLADDSLTRSGHYEVYARRASLIVMVPGLPAMSGYWKPRVYFVPDDVSMKPEAVYDGDPVLRGVKAVAVHQPKPVKKKKLQEAVFRHIYPVSAILTRFYKDTGQRWEVLYLRERDRCQKAGEAFDWPELPLDPSVLS